MDKVYLDLVYSHHMELAAGRSGHLFAIQDRYEEVGNVPDPFIGILEWDRSGPMTTLVCTQAQLLARWDVFAYHPINFVWFEDVDYPSGQAVIRQASGPGDGNVVSELFCLMKVVDPTDYDLPYDEDETGMHMVSWGRDSVDVISAAALKYARNRIKAMRQWKNEMDGLAQLREQLECSV